MSFALGPGSRNSHAGKPVALVLLHWHQLGDGCCSNSPTESCQGFSTAGKRRYDDERNLLFEQYLELVKLVKPLMLLIENVQGFAKSFTKTERGANGKQIHKEDFNADKELRRRLIEEMDYIPFKRYILKAK